jgi:hypothetical protein
MLPLLPIQNYLAFFSIDDVHLDGSPTPVLDDDDEFHIDFSELKTVVFQNMRNTRCVRQFLDFLGEPSNLHISRCRLGPGFHFEGTLSLKEIDVGEDLVEFLRACYIEKLVIDSCPGFGDEVLNAMMTANPSADLWGALYCARRVQDLLIHNCLDFSISTLKQMVENRRHIRIQCDPNNFLLARQQPSPMFRRRI